MEWLFILCPTQPDQSPRVLLSLRLTASITKLKVLWNLVADFRAATVVTVLIAWACYKRGFACARLVVNLPYHGYVKSTRDEYFN